MSHTSREVYADIVWSRLRCDRKDPCSSCTIRAVSCSYTLAPIPRHRTKQRKQVADPIERIARLEQLITDLTSKQKENERSTSESTNFGPETCGTLDSSRSSSVPHMNDAVNAQDTPLSSGRIDASAGQVVYFSATHWATLCDEISSLRSHFEQTPIYEDNYLVEDYRPARPLLLQGLQNIPNRETLLRALPNKPLADLLVDRFFVSAEPSVVMIHSHTFKKEYNTFWNDPYDFSLTWLALLYGVLSMSAFSYFRAGDLFPDTLWDAETAMTMFHIKSTECLLASNYLRPGRYTIEALLLNLQQEFVQGVDTDDGVWALAGTIIRIAMRMGYQRDPKHYPDISSFQGEMRRRVWALVLQLDTLVSFQLGLPRMIILEQCDTSPPRSLPDDDISPDSISLPPSRSAKEYVPIAFTIAKGRILTVFSDILSRSTSIRSRSYQEDLQLDKELNKSYDAIPECLRMGFPRESEKTAPQVVIRKYLLQLLYQKARCTLHRDRMSQARNDPTFHYSRATCLDAALKLLGYQFSMHEQGQRNGALHRNQWFLSSLEYNDFILAAMIVCLELSYRMEQSESQASIVRSIYAVYDHGDLLHALRRSQQIWNSTRTHSKVASQAARILSLMVAKATAVLDKGVLESQPHVAEPEYMLQESYDMLTLDAPSPELTAIGDMINAADDIDWVMWENHLRNISINEAL